MILGVPRGTSGALNCFQVGRRLQRHLDGELDARTAELVALHLEACRRCGMQADEYRRIKAALARAEIDDVSLDRLRRFAADLAGHGPERLDDEPH